MPQTFNHHSVFSSNREKKKKKKRSIRIPNSLDLMENIYIYIFPSKNDA